MRTVRAPTWWWVAAAVWAFALPPLAGETGGLSSGADRASGGVIRLGIGPNTWTGVNENDAEAAIRAWARSILAREGIRADAEVRRFNRPEGLAEAFGAGQLDCAALGTPDFLSIEARVGADSFYAAEREGEIAVRYVLLVRKNGAIHAWRDLRGRRLIIPRTIETCLARAWLDLTCRGLGLGGGIDALCRVREVDKPMHAILPVFFGQADAGLVTSNAFQVAAELNPQLRQRLGVLAVSPPVIPTVFIVNQTAGSSMVPVIERAIPRLPRDPKGRQILALWQCDAIVRRPLSGLEATRDLWRRWKEGGVDSETPSPSR